MARFKGTPIQYGVKLVFADGTVVNWYRDGKRKTVFPEKNPHGHHFPRSAGRIEEILRAVEGASADTGSGPHTDETGRPVGAFDGGASPNPGRGGWGVVLPDGSELFGGEPHTTNNRMELTAAIHLLEATAGPLRAIGDSRYVIEGITRWIHRWRLKDWRTVSGAPVENRDLWERLGELAGGRAIVWERVAGHTGHVLNERCDRLCAKGRKQVRTPAARGGSGRRRGSGRPRQRQNRS